MIINNLSETKKYEIVYVDPPWEKKKGGLRKSRPNQTRDLDYKTLPNDEIKNIIKQGFNGQEIEYELYNIKDVATVYEQF